MESVRYFQILIYFRSGEKIGEPFLLDHASKDEIETLIKERCIVHVSNTSLGDRQFMITDYGKQMRDSR